MHPRLAQFFVQLVLVIANRRFGFVHARKDSTTIPALDARLLPSHVFHKFVPGWV